MVVLVNLEDEDSSDSATPHIEPGDSHRQTNALSQPNESMIDGDQLPRDNPNLNGFSAALGCYPVVLQIASHLDLNSLHDLSATCRQFRANLLQFRVQLRKITLRCINDELKVGPKLASRMREAHSAMTRTSGRAWVGQLTSGRVGLCARDMVGECRRCGMVVCRNCSIKPPPQAALKGRHRRLCRTCMKAPLRYHIDPSFVVLSSSLPAGPPHIHSDIPDEHPLTFTSEAFSRSPCTCESYLYICLSCGSALRSADTTYMRGWTWRTRYSTYLGGLGTGIGEGNEGVECGKGPECIAAREVEKEIDCDADELAAIRAEEEHIEGTGRSWGGTSYMTQEIEGIGGVVKKKVKKRVKVGAVVKEYEDEREEGGYLSREQQGLNRSWCCWCSRVVPGNKDHDQADAGLLFHTLTNGSSSSSFDIHDP